jgi:outer membrane scaffolding protein for murein synthesis (MipA/OmpV family)
VYLSASLPDAPVVPCLSVYRDVEEADGFYATLGLSKEYAFNEEKTTLGLSASLGGGDQDYNDFYFGVKDDALNDVTVGASLAHAFTDAVTLTPGVLYSSLVDSDIRDGARELYGKSDELVGSLTLTVTF